MSTEKTVSDIMTRKVVTLFEEDNLTQVRANLARYRFHHLPVVDDGKLVGMLSHHDLLRASAPSGEHITAAQFREERMLERSFVRDLMQTDLVTATPSLPIKLAAKRMLERRVGALPVVDADNNLIGIVTEHDLVRSLVEDM